MKFTGEAIKPGKMKGYKMFIEQIFECKELAELVRTLKKRDNPNVYAIVLVVKNDL